MSVFCGYTKLNLHTSTKSAVLSAGENLGKCCSAAIWAEMSRILKK